MNNITYNNTSLAYITTDNNNFSSLLLFNDEKWTITQFYEIIQSLTSFGCISVKTRPEYTLLKEIVNTHTLTEVSNTRQPEDQQNTVISGLSDSGVNSSYCSAIKVNDTDTTVSSVKKYTKPFMAPLDIQKNNSISDVIPSFKVIQSNSMSLNIGFDTEFQNPEEGVDENRRVLSLQMTIALGDILIRYFFLVTPDYQEVTSEGGKIPLKHCLADILSDLNSTMCFEFPLVRKEDIIFKEKVRQGKESAKLVDYSAMAESVIPVTLVCHTGKADIPVFRRSKYDIDLPRKIGEIQGGWMTTENVRFRAENDANYNYYWLVNLTVRDTLGLTPADNKSLNALGNVIGRPKIVLPDKVIAHMSSFAVSNPVEYYKYAMNDADIVVSFCAELFQFNHSIPMTLSSAAAASMYVSIKSYFGVKKKADYDRIYRGLEMLDEGMIPSEEECMKFLKATRYVPIRDNPDAKLITEYFEEAYTGGFNASFYIGWITENTTDFDLQNAYPTAMANIIDIDWSKNVRDFPRNYELTLQDLTNPLIPSVAVGDFEFPEDCYCPNIPVPVQGGMKIYPRKAKHVYMSGPDMYLALHLGAKITIFRGFTCQMLTHEGKPSQCLAYAVTNLVQDRMKAKVAYKDNPLVEKSLKTMVNSCYGKTAQNVSPKTRYNARSMGRVDAEPSTVTSPYHATYTTALVRCMLIACINQLHDMGYTVYSVTTDGFITNAPTDVVRNLDAFGFADIFQNGRYILNQTDVICEANQVWEPKHFNDTFLNITTRGNVAVNDGGVLAHNSYTTGEEKDSRADRDAFIIAVLSREGVLKCPTKVWTKFSEIVERHNDFHVENSFRELSMNFDYKRCPILESSVDTPVSYTSIDGLYHVDTVIAEYDTRPYHDIEEFLNYRKTVTSPNEKCIKITKDLERVKVKSTTNVKGYIGKDLDRKILLSILMGYRSGIYDIPVLDGLKQSDAVAIVNSWGISEISINDWKNCSRSKRQENMLPRELVEKMLQNILSK